MEIENERVGGAPICSLLSACRRSGRMDVKGPRGVMVYPTRMEGRGSADSHRILTPCVHREDISGTKARITQHHQHNQHWQRNHTPYRHVAVHRCCNGQDVCVCVCVCVRAHVRTGTQLGRGKKTTSSEPLRLNKQTNKQTNNSNKSKRKP